MSILAVLGVVVSSAAMIVVLSGFGGLKNYSLEFISSVSPDYKISSKKGSLTWMTLYLLHSQMRRLFLGEMRSDLFGFEIFTCKELKDVLQQVT